MSAITLEAIQAKQSELGALIQKFKDQSQARTIHIEGRAIELHPGARYAGAKLDDDGKHLHDVIVLAARTDDTYTFDEAQAWAESVGGDAPSPEECALIKANCPDVLTRWIWTNKPYADNASCAWLFFSNGRAGNLNRSAEGGALAVRRV